MTSKNGAQDCKSKSDVNPKTEINIINPKIKRKSVSIIEILLKKK